MAVSSSLSQALNSKFIFDRLPLVHSIVFLVEMAIVARLITRFNTRYEERPILTMMVTNAVLGGIADTVAQSITAFQQRRQVLRKELASKNNERIPLDDWDDTPTFANHDLIPEVMPDAPPPSFDMERLTRFMAYGCGMAPVQFKWFRFLEKSFPMTSTSAMGPALKRVVFDQLIFSPLGIAWFFTVMTVAEGGGRRAVQNKLCDMFVPTLKANFVIWPLVQIINFRLMPVQFQLPFVSTIGIAWTAFLSLANSAEDAVEAKALASDAQRIRLT